MRRITIREWHHEGERLFGPNRLDWRFVCPACGHVATADDWMRVGAQSAIGYSCIGRWSDPPGRDAFKGRGGGPCNYAGGGLFRIHKLVVIDEAGLEHWMFEFDRTADSLKTSEMGVSSVE